MAKPGLALIDALRATARRLEKSGDYQWGHMGACNCGFLAQVVAHLDKQDIHLHAMQGYGDWTEQLRDYCPTSGRPLDEIISTLLDLGFDTGDLAHLERLSDLTILSSISALRRTLQHNVRADVIVYFNAWAAVLEDELLREVSIQPALTKTRVIA
jgi:hypothetical protein